MASRGSAKAARLHPRSRSPTPCPPAPPPQPAPAPPALVFDACHVGVVLRAVLFVETVVAVGALFGAGSPVEWLIRTSILTGGALPASLLWLIVACSLKRALQRLSVQAQYAAGVALGAIAGLYGCGLLAMVGMVGMAQSAPWLASAASGALLAAALVAALVLRARGMTPAATSAQLAELQARIRPHFLFNTLNSAIALVRAEPAKAEALLEDLSDLFRHALQDQGESVTLADEVALAQRYLAIEQVRFGEISKERLLAFWEEVLSRTGLEPQFEEQVTSIDRSWLSPSANAYVWVDLAAPSLPESLVLSDSRLISFVPVLR